MTATVQQNDAAMRVIYQREREARAEEIRQLTEWTAEKGPLGNFGASLLGLARDTIPAFGAALDGFVQGGPLGAVTAVFLDLFQRSDEFLAFIDGLMDALGPLIDIIGKALSPILNALVWVVTGVVDVLTAIWNFLFGWIPGMRVEREREEREATQFREPLVHDRDPPETAGSLTGGGMSQAVQLGIALPLREAADIQMLAAQTQLQAANLFAEYVGLLSEYGVNVHDTSAVTAPNRPTLAPVVYRGSVAR